MSQPIAFELGEKGGVRVASNGAVRLSLHEPDGKLFLRRGIAGISARASGDVLIPKLNELAGDLLANPEMKPSDAVGRLIAIAGLLPTAEPKRIEWAVVSIDGINVYTDGCDVIVSRRELVF